jgi:hypothetical protein
MLDNAGIQRLKRIFGDNGRVREGFQMCMMMLNCLIQMQRRLNNCVLEVHVFIKPVMKMMHSKILFKNFVFTNQCCCEYKKEASRIGKFSVWAVVVVVFLL